MNNGEIFYAWSTEGSINQFTLKNNYHIVVQFVSQKMCQNVFFYYYFGKRKTSINFF